MGLHDVDQYVSTGGAWVAKAPLDVQRFSFGAAYLDEGVYVVGGNHYCNASSDESCHATSCVLLQACTELAGSADELRVIHSVSSRLSSPKPAGNLKVCKCSGTHQTC